MPPPLFRYLRLWLLLLTAAGALAGCGLLAAPCRVASAGLKAVPLVGHPAAVPTDSCAATVDP
ncbi:MAG: phosphoribosylglycinamide formyltransferase [Acidisphaera sp.]|nr:phosphoribosylglycinamide formyltransferase [Acidisphaera sp.]